MVERVERVVERVEEWWRGWRGWWRGSGGGEEGIGEWRGDGEEERRLRGTKIGLTVPKNIEN